MKKLFSWQLNDDERFQRYKKYHILLGVFYIFTFILLPIYYLLDSTIHLKLIFMVLCTILYIHTHYRTYIDHKKRAERYRRLEQLEEIVKKNSLL